MKYGRYSFPFALSLALAACSDDSSDDNGKPEPAGQIDDTPDSGAGGDGEHDGHEGHGGSGGEGGSGGDGSGDVCEESNGVVDSCTDEREALLGPVDKVTEGDVRVLAESGATKTLYVDASAGGPPNAGTSPYVYIKLSTGGRVDLKDAEAYASLDWDLAVKRASFLTNSGHAGPGVGGAIFLDGKAFEDVSLADVATVSIPQEELFDASCVAVVDGRGAAKTTFDGWYDYDPVTHATPPKDGTFLVRGADCAVFKVRIDSNTATPDGDTDGATTGRYLLRVAPL